jgi:hypothetical protein
MNRTASVRDAVACYRAESALIGFHCADQNSDMFFAGYVEDIEEDRFLLRYVNRGGQPGEGGVLVAWFIFDEIAWVRAKTPYLNGVAILYGAHERFSQLKTERWKTARTSIVKVLGSCLKSGEACRVKFRDDEDECAIVKGLGAEFVKLELLGEDAQSAGELILKLEYITGVKTGGLESATMTFLTQGENQALLRPERKVLTPEAL